VVSLIRVVVTGVGMVVAIDRDDERGGDGFVHGIKQILSALQVTLP